MTSGESRVATGMEQWLRLTGEPPNVYADVPVVLIGPSYHKPTGRLMRCCFPFKDLVGQFIGEHKLRAEDRPYHEGQLRDACQFPQYVFVLDEGLRQTGEPPSEPMLQRFGGLIDHPGILTIRVYESGKCTESRKPVYVSKARLLPDIRPQCLPGSYPRRLSPSRFNAPDSQMRFFLMPVRDEHGKWKTVIDFPAGNGITSRILI